MSESEGPRMEGGERLLPEELRDQFDVLEELGRGASGLVLRARQRSLDRTVVLKLLRLDRLEDQEQRLRFEREARLLARIQDPHVLPILDHGVLHDFLYLVLPDDQGRALDEVFPAGEPLPWRQVVEILDQLLLGLEALHQEGVLHRDIKPANILRREDGSWALIDLGLALVEGSNDRLTRTGHVVGTPLYMAPEPLRGAPPTRQDDLYSLGVVAYTLATGANPFEGSTLGDTMGRQVLLQPPPIRAKIPDFPEALDELIQRMISKQGARRPASARKARRELAQAVSGGSRGPRPPRREESPSSPYRAAAGALLFLALILLGAWSTPGTRISPTPQPSRGVTRPEPPAAPTDWFERLEREVESQGSSLPRDSLLWPRALSRLPVLRGFLEALARGELQLGTPERERLLQVGREYRALGLHDPLRALATSAPATEPVPVPDPAPGVPPEARGHSLGGWAGTAFRLDRELRDRARALERDLYRVQDQTPPISDMPPALVPRIRLALPILALDNASPLYRSFASLWTEQQEIRQQLIQWIELDTLRFEQLLRAARGILEDPELRDTWVGDWVQGLPQRHKAFTFSATFLVPPQLSQGWVPRSYRSGTFLLGLSAYVLRRRRESQISSPEELDHLVQEAGETLAFLERDSGDPSRCLSLVLTACRDARRPGPLLEVLEASRELLTAHPIPIPKFCEELEAYLEGEEIPGCPG